MKNYDIVAVGECLIDFLAQESQDGKKMLLEGNPGGAPANVLVAAAKLGRRTAFLGKVGGDAFGHFVKNTLEEAGVDIGGLVFGPQPTTLAMVALDDAGNRSFSFYRSGTADVEFLPEELDAKRIQSGRIFHFGSVSMTAEPARATTLKAAGLAAGSGALVSFDPNLRPMLWRDLEDARDTISAGMRLADLVKVSGEELEFLTGDTDPVRGGRLLMERFGMQLLAVTLGLDGCVCFTPDRFSVSRAYDVSCIDTTGAGDAFWGAALTWILGRKEAPSDYTQAQLEQLAQFANAAGSLATTAFGAIPAMPDRAEIEACITNIPRLA